MSELKKCKWCDDDIKSDSPNELCPYCYKKYLEDTDVKNSSKNDIIDLLLWTRLLEEVKKRNQKLINLEEKGFNP
jgi:hypothetical protein